MQIEATNNQNIGFSYTTSSGKSLSLSMFDNQSASYSKEDGSASLSLRREYGFSFTFEGSKLTQTDIAEIKDAMKNVEPLINDFLQNSKVGELNPRDFIQSAMQMADILPTPSDENKLNATMDSLVSKFDQLLKQNQSNDSTQNAKMLEDSKKLIEEVLARLRQQMLQQTQEFAPQKTNAEEEKDKFNTFAFYAWFAFKVRLIRRCGALPYL